MRLDTANRSFYAIVGLAAAPFLFLGLLGCGVLSVTAYRILTNGAAALGNGPASVAATIFLGASAVGTGLATRSLLRQCRATTRLTARLRARQVPVAHRLRAIASDAGVDEIRLVDDPDAYSLTAGLITPVVYVSTGLLDRTSDYELAAVLVHERYHVANHDPLKIALARALVNGMFLLPAARHLLDRYLIGRELGADRRALRRCGRPALAGALLRSVGGPGLPATGAAAAFGGAQLLEVRLTQLETDDEPELVALSPTVVATTAAGLVAMATGLVATVVAVGAPTAFDAAPNPVDLAGGAVCAAMWIIGVLALRRHRDRTPGGLTRPHPPRTTGT